MVPRIQYKGKRPIIGLLPPLIMAISLILFMYSLSIAGGLYLNEFGTPSMRVTGAGANAVASDASTSFHNAAGMTRLDGKQLMGTGGLLYATVKFDPDADTPIPRGDGGDAGGPVLINRGFYVHSLSDKLKEEDFAGLLQFIKVQNGEMLWHVAGELQNLDGVSNRWA